MAFPLLHPYIVQTERLMILVTVVKIHLPSFWCLAIASGGAYCNRTADVSHTAPVVTRKRRKPVQVKKCKLQLQKYKCTKYKKWTG